MIPTSPQNLERINNFFRDIEPTVEYLYGRWFDESEFEDIKEYGEFIKKHLPDGFHLICMTKKPFGFKFHIGTDAVYHLKINNVNYEWKRVK